MSALPDVDVRAAITAAVTETFDTKLSMALRPVEQEPPPWSGVQCIAGTLNLAGKVTGIVKTQTTFAFGRLMASAMHGVASEAMESDTAINDLIAEITGIVAGSLKSALNDAGRPCILSPPSIVSGTDFSIHLLDMDRLDRCAFQKDDHVVIVEVGLKDQENADRSIDFDSPESIGRRADLDLQKLDATDFNRLFAGAVVDRFGSILSLKPEEVEPDSVPDFDGMRSVFAVCFAGDAAGVVSLHVGPDLLRRMEANMPNVGPENGKGKLEIGAVIGELVAAAGDNLKSVLTDTGLRCFLCTPTLTSGSDFRIETFNSQRFQRWAFRCDGHFLFMEMGLGLSGPTAETKSPIAGTAGDSAENRAAASTGAFTGSASRRASEPKDSRAEKIQSAPEDFDLELLLDIPVELMVELGRTKMTIGELLKLQPGSAVKLSDLEGDPVDILANDVLIARGEVVVRNEKYGIRITEITSRMERLKGLK